MPGKAGFTEQEFGTGELSISVGPAGVYLVDAYDECEPLPDGTAELLHVQLGAYLEHRKEGRRDARE